MNNYICKLRIILSILFIFLTCILLVSSLVSLVQQKLVEEKIIEGFSSDKKYILLGDSILQNKGYVADGNNVENLLREKNLDVICFAEDNSKISDVFIQLNSVSVELNSEKTYVFLSAGGNNILSYYVDNNGDVTNSSALRPMFSSYKNLVKSIQTKLPKAKICILDIYYPDNISYRQFHSIISDWNNMLYAYAGNNKNGIHKVINISEYLTQKTDFSFGIEPSSIGGKKIADLISTTQ